MPYNKQLPKASCLLMSKVEVKLLDIPYKERYGQFIVPSAEEEVFNSNWAEELLDALSVLPDDELHYIVMRFGIYSNPLDTKEIHALYYPGFALEEIIEMEERILGKLSGNEKIRELIKEL